MTDIEELLDAIANGPAGPEVGAFFDVDGTLLDGYTAFAFYEQRLRSLSIGPSEFVRSLLAGLDMELRGGDVSELMRVSLQAWAGREESELLKLGERLFTGRIAGCVYPESRALVAAHQRMGHTLVIASSATRAQVGPLARDLDFDHVLCTEIGVRDGRITGEVEGPILWGPGKAAAVSEIAVRESIDLERSYGYANGDEDVPFLELVGHPRALNPGSDLARIARDRSWPIRRFGGRARPGLTELVRTSAALGGAGAAAAVGLSIGMLNRSRRDARNVAGALGGDLGLALAGIRVDVVGEERLWSHRPAVFIFNHQSSLDVLLLARLLRRDFTAVAKKELARDPRFAPLGFLGDVAYVDRSDAAQAREALVPVVEKLRGGTSIVMAPEGTRSPTPRPGRFKKGAFHVAMQAGVPIVPIVIRNAGELMWRNSFFLRPGRIEVAVLEPISVEDWKPRALTERVSAVRELFVRTLEDWPAPGSHPGAPSEAPPNGSPPNGRDRHARQEASLKQAAARAERIRGPKRG